LLAMLGTLEGRQKHKVWAMVSFINHAPMIIYLICALHNRADSSLQTQFMDDSGTHRDNRDGMFLVAHCNRIT